MDTKKLYAKQALRTARVGAGLSRQEFADLLTLKLNRDVSRSIYEKWEQGKRPTDTQTALIISRELKQRLTELWEAK